MFWKKWWKTIVVIVGIIALTVGGIVLVNHTSKTGDIALDDDFTSKFIDRSVEVDDGFHFFESQNGHYTMWFPSGYYLSDDPMMYITQDHYEVLSMYEKAEDGSREDVFSGTIYTMYRGAMNQWRVQNNLEMLLDDRSYDGEYEKIETEDTIIYYGSSHHSLEDKKGVFSNPKDSYANQYFALIQNKEGDQFLTVDYSLYCPNEEESGCGNNGEKEASFFDTFIRNIKFR
ncbi:hypothetical protein [Shouchella lonarensis]|uniref:Uncharacterized protein n=1 Tax=Shouchella lonarensis TaxID=1464122 RepID=A0A1G6HZ37_9BACI|nr:hypothetical protein [Shouchella lonarensis]SDB99403.1 hypothetical protein SAMN05421737_104239 [Shouchella lonarensis]